MIVIGVWLISTFLISVTFRNHILEDMVIVIPNRVIDSWYDLKDKTDIKIRAYETDYIVKYVEISNDKMAANLKNLLDPHPLPAFNNKSFILQVMDEISSGKTAMIESRTTLIYHMIHYYVIHNYSDPLFLQRLHISKYGGGSVPFFLPLVSSKSWLLPHYNRM